MEQLNEVDLDTNRKCAEVVSVKSPFEFWVRLEDTKADYESMLEQLQVDYRHAHEDRSCDLKGPGLGLACTYNHKLLEWHRCEIQSVIRSNAFVLFIDTGETDLVPLKSVKFLKDRYKSINRFALRCSLHNVRPCENETVSSAWSPASVVVFEKLVYSKTVALVFKSRTNGLYLVDMFIRNQSVVELMIREGVATVDDTDANSSSIGADPHFLSSRALANALRDLDPHERFIARPKITASLVDEHEIIVTHIISPFCFYVQLANELSEYADFETDLQTYYNNARGQSSIALLKEPQVGQMCVARYSEDGQWYRAVVKQINDDSSPRSCVVFFVDYGNDDTVPVTDALLRINDQFKSFPTFAVKCALNGIRAPAAAESESPAYAQTVADFMYESLAGKLLAKFVGRISYSDCYLVEVAVEPIDEGNVASAARRRRDLAQMLVEARFVVKKPSRGDVQLGQAYDVNVTQIYSPYYFYIQFVDQMADFEVFAAEIQTYYAAQLVRMDTEPGLDALVMLKKPRVGQLCVARYSGDEQLYRAVIKEISSGSETARVFFVDYGNEDMVPLSSDRGALFKITEKFKDYPAMAYKCCLHGVQPLAEHKSDRSKQAEIADFMFESIGERAVCRLVAKSPDDCYLVELSIDEGSQRKLDFAALLIDRNYACRLSLTAEATSTTSRRSEASLRSARTVEALKPTPERPATAVKLYQRPEIGLQVNEKCTFLVTHIETVRSFYVRPNDADSANEMKRLSSDLQYFYEKKINLSPPALVRGAACAYYDDEKKSWHRAQVVQPIDAEHCTVRLVDVGTIKFVNVVSLKELYDKYLEMPCQAAHASLNDLTAAKSSSDGVEQTEPLVDEKFNIRFREIAANKSFFGKVVAVKRSAESGDARETVGECKYLLNLFDKSGDSVYSMLATDLDSTVSRDVFKPGVKSRLEETALNESESLELSVTVPPLPTPPVNAVKTTAEPLVKPVSAKDVPDSARAQPPPPARVQPQDPRPPFTDSNSRARASVNIDDESPFPKHGSPQARPQQTPPPPAKEPTPAPVSALSKFAPSQQPAAVSAINPAFQPSQKPSGEPPVVAAKQVTFAQPLPPSAVAKPAVQPPTTTTPAAVAKASPVQPVNDRAIFQQANEEELKKKMIVLNAADGTKSLGPSSVLDAVVANMDDGLQYIYFNLHSTLPALRKLEADLEADFRTAARDLVKIKFIDLKFNTHYLVRLGGRLYRGKLLAPTRKLTLSSLTEATFVVQLVDYGTRVSFGMTAPATSPPVASADALRPTIDVAFFQMTVYYARVHSMALHCRLPLANAIENTWTAEERAQFFGQIRVGQSYKIKILTPFEPCVFEFHNEDGSIRFQFDSIISRLAKNRLDPPTFLAGTTHLASLAESFALNLGSRRFQLDDFHLFSTDATRLNELKFLVNYLNSTIEQQLAGASSASWPLKLSTVKVDEVILGRPRPGRPLLERLTPALRELVVGRWSRIEVRSISTSKSTGKRLVRLLYLDFGFEDVIADELQADVSYMCYGDYDLIKIPVQFKIWPAFAYKCALSPTLLKRKCGEAARANGFFDARYLAAHVASLGADRLGALVLRADFSENFVRRDARSSDAFFVDLVDAKSEQNLVDMLITSALGELPRHEFACIAVHVNSLDDFYLQKSDAHTQDALVDLQTRIQERELAGQLKQLRLVPPNCVCVARFDDDGQFYRARVIGKPAAAASGSGDGLFDVRFIDYGNTSRVGLDKLREIPAEFVDGLPDAFAIQCQLKLTPEQAGQAAFRAELEEFFYEKLNDFKFYARCLERLNKAGDGTSGNKFLVDLYESESRKLIQELMSQVSDEPTTSLVAPALDRSEDDDDDEDDAAIAESFTQASQYDPTNQNMTELDVSAMSHSVQPQVRQTQVALSMTQEIKTATTKREEEAKVVVDITWEETDPNIRNYNFDHDAYASTCYSERTNQTGDNSVFEQSYARQKDNSELLYSTAHENQDSVVFGKDVTDAGHPTAQDQSSQLTFNDESLLSLPQSAPVTAQAKEPGRRFSRLKYGDDKQYSYMRTGQETDEEEEEEDDEKPKLPSSQAESGASQTATAAAADANATDADIQEFVANEERGECSTGLDDYLYDAGRKRKSIQYDVLCTSGHGDGEQHTCSMTEQSMSVSMAAGAKNTTTDAFPDNSVWKGQADASVLSNRTLDVKNTTVDGFQDSSVWQEKRANATAANLTLLNNRNTTVDGFQDGSVWSKPDETAAHETSAAVNETRAEGFPDQSSNWSRELDAAAAAAATTTMADQSTKWVMHGNQTVDYQSHTINEENQSVWSNEQSRLVAATEQPAVKYATVIDGFVTHVSSFDRFYVQKLETPAQLETMQAKIDQCSEKRLGQGAELEALCIARYSEDGQLYRAKVVACGGPSAADARRVHYIDYGNEDDVGPDDLFHITAELRDLPPLAIECQLEPTPEFAAFLAACSTEEASALVEAFRAATVELEVRLKVRKVLKNIVAKRIIVHERTMLADAFFLSDGDDNDAAKTERNVCDHLLETFAKERPTAFQAVQARLRAPKRPVSPPKDPRPHQMPLASERRLEDLIKSDQFDALLVNYEPFNARSETIEISLVNLQLVQFIDELVGEAKATRPETMVRGRSLTDASDCCFFVPMPTELAELAAFKHGLARAQFVREISATSALVRLVDFDMETSVEKTDVVGASLFFRSAVPSALERCSLHVANLDEMRTLEPAQVAHLNELFKLLVNISLTRSSATMSSRLYAVTASTNASGRRCMRLNDVKREHLDVSYMMQVCVSVLVQPFTGTVTGMESDLSAFDACHLAGSPKTLKELQKILKQSSYIRNVCAHIDKPGSAPVPVGAFCLVDLSGDGLTNFPLLDDGNSIVHPDSVLAANDFAIARGFVVEESNETYLVFNVDTGKKLTVNKRRLIALERVNPLIDLLDKSLLFSKTTESILMACSTNLVHLLPFMAVKGRLATPPAAADKEAVSKLFKGSRFFNEKMSFRLLGSWATSTVDRADRLNAAYQFLQDERTLCRFVELVVSPPPSSSSSSSSQETKVETAPIEPVKRQQMGDFGPRKPTTTVKAVQSPKSPPPAAPYYFKLSHARSLNCFYLHSNEVEKNLQFIEEQIEIESCEQAKQTVPASPKPGEIYGLFDNKEDRFYRVRVLEAPSEAGTLAAFFPDHGFTRQVRPAELIPIGDPAIQQFAPQAVCCKLVGFDELARPENAALSASMLAVFRGLLEGKPFMATVFSRFTHFKRIDNFLPTQANNSKPLEVVLHLFRSDSHESCIENQDRSYVADYNETLAAGNADADVAALMRKTLAEQRAAALAGQNGHGPSRKTSTSQTAQGGATATSPLVKSPQKVFRPLPSVASGSARHEVRVEIANIYNPNEVYLKLDDWQERIGEMHDALERDYAQDTRLLFNKKTGRYSLDESDLRPNLPCALVDRERGEYYRARVVSYKLSAKTGRLLVKVFLIDGGSTRTEIIELLYPLLDKYYDMPALCFECSLGYKPPSPDAELRQATRVLDLKTRTLAHFTASVVEQFVPAANNLAGESLARYVVNLYGHRRDASAVEPDAKRVSLFKFLNEFMSSVGAERVASLDDEQLRREIESFDAARTTRVPRIQINNGPDSDAQEVEQQRRAHQQSGGAMPQQLIDSSFSPHSETAFPYKELDLPLGKALKIQLACIDTSKHFAVTQLAHVERRKRFLADLQTWLKENRDKLKPVFEADYEESGGGGGGGVYDRSISSYIGTPCVIKSTQLGGKWCRGFVSLHHVGASFSYIYLVDYCKSVQVTNDRVYQLTRAEFINEPALVSRCQLVDQPDQKAKFEKYQSLINVPAPVPPPASNAANGAAENSMLDASQSYISLDNIEIQIRCTERRQTPLNQMTRIENWQYTVEIVDMKRIKCSFPQSPILKVQPPQQPTFNGFGNGVGSTLHAKTLTSQFHMRQQIEDTDDDCSSSIQTRSLTIVETLTSAEREFDRQQNGALANGSSSANMTNGSSYHRPSSSSSSSATTTNGSKLLQVNGGGGGRIGVNGFRVTSPLMDVDHSLAGGNDTNCSSVCESTRITPTYQDDNSQSLGSSHNTFTRSGGN